MLEDTDAQLVLSSTAHKEKMGESSIKVMVLDEDCTSDRNEEQSAATLVTSLRNHIILPM